MGKSCELYASCCLLTSFCCCCCLVCRTHHMFQTPLVLSKPLLCAYDRAGMSARLKQVVSLSSAVCSQLHSHCSRQVISLNKRFSSSYRPDSPFLALLTMQGKLREQVKVSADKLYYMASSTLPNGGSRWFVISTNHCHPLIIAAMLGSRHLPCSWFQVCTELCLTWSDETAIFKA